VIDRMRVGFARLRSILSKRQRDADFDTELAVHLELLIQDSIARACLPRKPNGVR
jgi:hypothetical protein